MANEKKAKNLNCGPSGFIGKQKGMHKKPLITEDTNKILLSLMYCENVTYYALCDYLVINYNTLYNWTQKGAIPRYKTHIDKLCNLFNIDESILFANYAYSFADVVNYEVNENFTCFHKPKHIVVKKIFYGLLLIYRVTVKQLEYSLNIGSNTIYRWIYTDNIPNEENQRKIEDFFNMPASIIFKNFKVENNKLIYGH